MSVINQMLRDLDDSNTPKPSELESVKTVQQSTKNYFVYWLLLFFILGLMLWWAFKTLPLLDDLLSSQKSSEKVKVMKVDASSLKVKSNKKISRDSVTSVQINQKQETINKTNAESGVPTIAGISSKSPDLKLVETLVPNNEEAQGSSVDKTSDHQSSKNKIQQVNSTVQQRQMPEKLMIVKNTLSNKEKALSLWRQAGQYPEQAESLLKQALKLNSGLKGARIALVTLLISKRDNRQAQYIIDQGLKIDVTQVAFVEWKARLLIADKKNLQAQQWLFSQQPVLKNHLSYYGLLAGLLSQHKDFAKASGWYQQLVKVQPENGKWWLGLAIASQKLLQKKQAITAYENALESKGVNVRSQVYIHQQLKILRTANGR